MDAAGCPTGSCKDCADDYRTGRSPFTELPDVMVRLADGMPALCHTVDYDHDSGEA